jgi:hypothetical protein
MLHRHQINVAFSGVIKLMIRGTPPLLACQLKRLETKWTLISHAENLQGKSEKGENSQQG